MLKRSACTSICPSLPILLAVPLVLASPGLAVDGVLEINQACAANTGCFPGDSAGLPVTIDGSAGVSYRLTSSLVVPDENTGGIAVSAPGITIDLNGFEITRAACVGSVAVCRPLAGTGAGIERSVFNLPGIEVKNGTISGMGTYGVRLGAQAVVENVRTRWNRLEGISVAFGGVVTGNSSLQNGGIGISADYGSIVSGNSSYDNQAGGISTGPGVTIIGNSVYANLFDGIETEFGEGSLVKENTVRGSTGFGLKLSADTAYSDNVLTNNGGGTISGGVNAGGNVCNGSLTCP